MEIIRNDWGDTAQNEAEIIALNIQHMTIEDYVRHLAYTMDIDCIVAWAINQPNFRTAFASEINTAEQDYAGSIGWWVEDDEETEDW